MTTKKTKTTTTELTIYQPEDFCVEAAKLFPGETEDWKRYCSEDGYLRLRLSIFPGAVGVEGSLSLGNPPEDEDLIDAWEGSKPAGTWDYWSMLGFITVPAGDYKSNIMLYFEHNTFFERSMDVIHTLPNEISEDNGNMEDCWKDIFAMFQKKFGARTLSDKVWISPNGTRYDDSAPDQ
jgi:hypothetical protein